MLSPAGPAAEAGGFLGGDTAIDTCILCPIANAAEQPSAALSRILMKAGLMTRLTKASVIHSDPKILSGTPVFVGTRVPVQSLFDYLEGGDTLDEFLRQFPSVKREQAIAALELARETLLTSARPA